jgi:hypothetical protein
MFRKASISVWKSTVVVPPDPLPLTPSASSSMKTPENTEESYDDPEPADEGDLQIEYSSYLFYTPSTGAVTSQCQ